MLELLVSHNPDLTLGMFSFKTSTTNVLIINFLVDDKNEPASKILKIIKNYENIVWLDLELTALPEIIHKGSSSLFLIQWNLLLLFDSSYLN